MRLPQLLRLLAALVLLVLWQHGKAFAYPQWQFSTGTTRCNQCHYSPSGGGLLNDYGRDANGEDLSTWQGDGSFMHGAVALPSPLKLGADLRFAMVSNDNGGPDQPKTAVFPMQADVHLRVGVDAFAFQATVGARGQLRRADGEVPASNFQPENESRMLSREHWVVWQPAAQGLYVRAGRFFAPFGLRLAEHVVYVRRDLGFNLFQETYNASVGYLSNDWEGHFTLIAPDFLQAGSQERGVAAYAEKRLLNEQAGGAVQLKYVGDEGVKRAVAGLVGKLYVEPIRVLFLGEANYLRQMPSGSSGVGQFVGLVGASWLPPVRGFLFTVFAERFTGNVSALDTSLGAFSGLVSWFPYPHFEVQVVGRTQHADGGRVINTFLAQLHYFL